MVNMVETFYFQIFKKKKRKEEVPWKKGLRSWVNKIKYKFLKAIIF
jgi:hypothetical protein